MRLSDPVMLQSIITKTGAIVASSELFLVMSILFVVPILMSFLDPDVEVSRSLFGQTVS